MARMLSKSPVLRGSILHHHLSSFLRHFSSKAKLIEIDLDSSSSTASAINKMEEMFHAIMVQKSTPDWLPFLPGSSFWVPLPPKGSKRVADVIEQLSNQLTREEFLSLTTGRGWPCFSFFIRAGEYADVAIMDVKVEFPQQAEGEVKVEVLIDSGDKSS
ncbi:uncharacterized protein LOC110410862 [Herrania umbratica]|uniref:Uncharacterized protein LOC110410862 n=1 Tax=Herrania umbratica TaxID=108875 RepID=A0A6J0ZNN7_9ROSI|nr:uncharacterized protein LOC110410862 [Herrania umbratica]XP_021276440.1 uncharacterized protein LOC110410862 [Herrania umbratica]XP_021276441.1 uncharacterized protein LOC110410862 [Herrania umbratica]XP_021276442.1 uncharacterized protein LOC110410862 [Herrania umbratica]XP_021276443.1 uncharacterized protein LOC110410862 [Herrania umbratica]